MIREAAQTATQGISPTAAGRPIVVNGASRYPAQKPDAQKAVEAKAAAVDEIDPAELAARRKMAIGFPQTATPPERDEAFL